MLAFPRPFVLSAATACFALVLVSTPAQATTHHKHPAKIHHHHIKGTSTKIVITIAQQHLANLGYYGGKIDGLMGPQTREAIKHFQYDKRLKVDGVLGPQTNAALEAEDHRVIGTHSIPLQDIVVGPDANVNPNYVTSLNGGTQPISSRFGRIDVTETGTGEEKRYNVNLNGQALLTADGQPSVIGISPSYDLGDEDAIVFTTFSPHDDLCTYKTHVLVINATNNQMLDVGDCTRPYQARVNGNSLYLSFPEHDDNRAIGATWRIEGMSVERL